MAESHSEVLAMHQNMVNDLSKSPWRLALSSSSINDIPCIPFTTRDPTLATREIARFRPSKIVVDLAVVESVIPRNPEKQNISSLGLANPLQSWLAIHAQVLDYFHEN
ncbi:hypothetical protein AMTR_s00017p00136120 [Amborella trichopoda]|uniref:Uncharacterized protein n=1 Tax=Amborella trichopoda TaxID=13333 RepID=W1PLD7_AMBTC|nr:hypothetical protein AMTR_s00017p00136120 [Amborella trichopoda]